MAEKNISERMQEKRSDYMGSKYSEHLFGQSGGKVSKLDADNSKEEKMEEFSAQQFWKDVNENNYQKKQTLSDKNKMIQREKLLSSGKILGDLRPKYLKRNMDRFLETITPEELETLILIKNNLIKEWKRATIIGALAMTPIYCLFLLLETFFILVFFPILAGFFIGGYMNAKPALILMDRLGNEYQLSRIYKQTIFTKRRDISDEMKAEIYMKMNKENEEFQEQLKKSTNGANRYL